MRGCRQQENLSYEEFCRQSGSFWKRMQEDRGDQEQCTEGVSALAPATGCSVVSALPAGRGRVLESLSMLAFFFPSAPNLNCDQNCQFALPAHIIFAYCKI